METSRLDRARRKMENFFQSEAGINEYLAWKGSPLTQSLLELIALCGEVPDIPFTEGNSGAMQAACILGRKQKEQEIIRLIEELPELAAGWAQHRTQQEGLGLLETTYASTSAEGSAKKGEAGV